MPSIKAALQFIGSAACGPLRFPTSRVLGSFISFDSSIGLGGLVSINARLKNSHFGPHCRILGGAEVNGVSAGSNVTVGVDSCITNCALDQWITIGRGSRVSHTSIGANTYTAEEVRISRATIGKYCSIGPGCRIAQGIHPSSFVSTSPVFYSLEAQCGHTFTDTQDFTEHLPVNIGSDVWIGANTYIMDGVTIGHGAIVAAGAVVTRNVSPYSVVGGVPAKPLRTRFAPEIVESLLSVRWWNWPEDRLIRSQHLIAGEDIRAFLDWIHAEVDISVSE